MGILELKNKITETKTWCAQQQNGEDRKELIDLKRKHEEEAIRDFPGGPVAKTLSFQCRGPRFDPWLDN